MAPGTSSDRLGDDAGPATFAALAGSRRARPRIAARDQSARTGHLEPRLGLPAEAAAAGHDPQAEVNVRLVDETLRRGSDGLTALTTDPDSTILLFRSGEVLTSGRQVDPAAVPSDLLTMTRDGVPARQRLRADGIPVIAVAQPLTDGQGLYVELFPLVQLDRTFRFLSGLLIGGTVLSGLIGTTLGSWASKRALRPLTELTAAASRIAGGDLKARLPAQADPGLAPLATTFNTTADALEQRVLRDARFASDVGHELRSPLTTIRVALSAILADIRQHCVGPLPLQLMARDRCCVRRVHVCVQGPANHVRQEENTSSARCFTRRPDRGVPCCLRPVDTDNDRMDSHAPTVLSDQLTDQRPTFDCPQMTMATHPPTFRLRNICPDHESGPCIVLPSAHTVSLPALPPRARGPLCWT